MVVHNVLYKHDQKRGGRKCPRGQVDRQKVNNPEQGK